MSFLTKFIGGGAPEVRAISYEDLFMMGAEKAGSGSKAGKSITPESALQVSTVYACVRILSDSVSTLPLDTYRRADGVRRPLRPRPEWVDFKSGPWSKIDVLGQTMVSLLLHGNAYVATYRSGSEVSWMEVLDPTQVTPERAGNEIIFKVGPSRSTLTRWDVLHLRGLTLPGALVGVSPITYARETVGLSLAATEMGATFFGNGATPGMVLEVPGKLSPTGAAALRQAWNEIHQGSGNAHRLAVATDGAKFAKITLSPDDAQFLQTRGFQVNDIARIYGVPIPLLQHSDGPEMGQSIQDKNTHFVQHSLRPWVERVEGGLSWVLVSGGAVDARGFVKINMDGLLRGDHSSRFVTYSQAVKDGILTINEIRAYEDLPPVPWGDAPISVQVQKEPPAKEDPAPEADPAAEEDPTTVEDEE